MDLWDTYAAKYLQKNTRGKEGSSESYPSDTVHGQSETHSRNWPIRKSVQNEFPFDRNESNERFSENYRLGNDLAVRGEASTSGGYGEDLANLRDIGGYNVLSMASVLPLLYGNRNYIGFGNESDEKRDISSREMIRFHKYNNQNQTMKSRNPYGYATKPLNSLESCLTAQMHINHIKMEEYVYGSLPSQSTQVVRPLLVTDGSRIIGRTSTDFKSKMRLDNGKHRMIVGASSLPRRSLEFQRRPKQSFGKIRPRRMSGSFARQSARPFHAQGPPNALLLLFLGIAIGIISTVATSRKEVDKVKELLKQSENLVQDLHEEIEMKDSLTLKELPCDTWNSPETEQQMDASRKCDNGDLDHQKKKCSDSMKKIEAELEAELERLEFNMKASMLERTPYYVELDPDFEADVIQGELRLNNLKRQPNHSSDSDRDVSETSTNNDSGNYAVSPRALSLRLHELIQSRLEARIAELETALQENQNRIKSMEYENMYSHKNLYSEVETSSTQENPLFLEEDYEINDRPLALNLSGEALDAFNDAYDEILQMSKLEEGSSAVNTVCFTDHEKNMCYQGLNCRDDEIRVWKEGTSNSLESDDLGETENLGDELEMLLIKQIVKKAKKGSVVLNAQRMLYSIDQ